MAAAPLEAESPADFGSGGDGKAARWREEIRHAQKGFDRWLNRCSEIERRYRAEPRNDLDDSVRFNVLWSNIETMLPAVYARPPVPVVMRRFRDQDPVGRAAAMILKRNIQHSIDVGELHALIKSVVKDWLLFARGTVWARYEPHFDTAAMPAGTPAIAGAASDEGVQITDDAENEQEEVAWEEVEWDFVHRDDFVHGPARTWPEVPWVARRVRMTRSAGVKRFGRKFRNVPLNWKPDAGATDRDGTPENPFFKRAVVWEIWDLSERSVKWIAEDHDELLDEVGDPLGLDGFFPCPRPLYGTTTTSSLVPVPDYVQYQDQAMELDDLTGRIAHVTSSIQVRGTYDSRFPAIGRIFDEGTENQLIPVEQYAELAAKGGLEGALDFVPVEQFVNVLASLLESRAQVKTDLYEITGIADILRGSTAPEETATAQRIKGRYATLRLTDRQLEVARYVRDVLRITGEIICKHFSPQTMKLASNFQASDIAQDAMPPGIGHNGGPPLPPEMAADLLFMQAVQLLRDDKLRSFRIDIEDQSTIALDDLEEQQQRVEFLTAVGSFIQQATQIPPDLAPALVPLFGKMLLFGVRGFRVGADMEGALEDALAKIDAQVAQKAEQPPPPSPEIIKAQADAQMAQMEMQAKQMQMQHDAQEAAAERELKLADMQAKIRQQEAQNAQDLTQHQIAVAAHEMDAQRLGMERVKADREYAIKLEELRLKELEIGIKARQADDGNEIKREAAEEARGD